MASGTHAVGIAMVGREPGVIEGRSLPGGGGVTRLAGGREIRRRMIWIGRGLIVGFVTGKAIRRNRGVVVVHVTAGAGDGGVLAGERERRIVVIE